MKFLKMRNISLYTVLLTSLVPILFAQKHTFSTFHCSEVMNCGWVIYFQDRCKEKDYWNNQQFVKNFTTTEKRKGRGWRNIYNQTIQRFFIIKGFSSSIFCSNTANIHVFEKTCTKYTIIVCGRILGLNFDQTSASFKRNFRQFVCRFLLCW